MYTTLLLFISLPSVLGAALLRPRPLLPLHPLRPLHANPDQLDNTPALPKRTTQGAAGSTTVTGKAIYFLTNDAQNAVVAMAVNPDGSLGESSITPTGGAGANSIDGMTGLPAVPDALVGQGALTIAGQV